MVTPIIYDFVADIKNNNNFYIAQTPQGDSRTRYLDIKVVDNGVPYNFDNISGLTFIISGTNAGGGTIYNSCFLTNEGNIRVALTSAMLGCSGVGKYKVTIYADDEVLSLFNFYISVEESAYDVNELTRSSEYTALANLISNASDFNKWIVGQGLPSIDQGNLLDLYLDANTSKVYQKTETEWVYQCSLGSQPYIAYALDDEGTGFTITYTGAESYLGICASQLTAQPIDPDLYTWIMISGGDNMRTSNYGGSDSSTVAQADNLKGLTVIEGITVPANDETSSTSVVVENENITTGSILEGIYTSIYGYNPINVTISNGSMTIIFPAISTAASAMVKIWNMPED